jgi:hypothetical protein
MRTVEQMVTALDSDLKERKDLVSEGCSECRCEIERDEARRYNRLNEVGPAGSCLHSKVERYDRSFDLKKSENSKSFAGHGRKKISCRNIRSREPDQMRVVLHSDV